ncbi:MAG: NADP-reducing hydrogenase subunit HndC [bacterium ADurb.Bin363]|nr:MAG: NADP-reducing hydrogenase subunit HndC [bacterium ADurb.Bin363]
MTHLETIEQKVQEEFKQYKEMLMICTGTGCVTVKSFNVRDKLSEEIKAKGLEKDYLIVPTGCYGFCAAGPIIVVQPEGIFYQKVKEEDVKEIVEEHLINGKPVERLMYRDPVSGEINEKIEDIKFFTKQKLIALRNKGLIDPENIEHYISRGGYREIRKILEENNPEGVINEIIASGIRGRGGGGFPTGVKWQLCRKAAIEKKETPTVICNGLDRTVIETDPHSVIEGMMIGAFATGAQEGFIYIRKEFAFAIKRLEKALAQARKYGFLGDNILNKNFKFDINIHLSAGAFVCGESSALMASMSGRVAEPKSKYIHNVERGFRDKPALLNNVETWANIPVIIEKGAKWFASIGTGDISDNPLKGSSGTKIFSLTGKLNNTGLAEVPMGTTLREIIYDIGGGIPGGKKFKAVQIGGPSGGCIPESLLDIKVDFDTLTEAGTIMGSGNMVVMDETACMVDVARYFVNFLKDESCGKCTPCREGLYALNNILTGICNGEGKEEDMKFLEELSETIQETSFCQLGATSPNPVLSTIRYFRDEYEKHIREKKCPAGVCKALISYSILEDKCIGCTMCAKKCPVNAITGENKKVHVLDKIKCIKCGICYDVCPVDAVERI